MKPRKVPLCPCCGKCSSPRHGTPPEDGRPAASKGKRKLRPRLFMMAEPGGRCARRAKSCWAPCGCTHPCLLMHTTAHTHPTSMKVAPHLTTCACDWQNVHERMYIVLEKRRRGEMPRERRPRRGEADPRRHRQYGPWLALPLSLPLSAPGGPTGMAARSDSSSWPV